MSIKKKKKSVSIDWRRTVIINHNLAVLIQFRKKFTFRFYCEQAVYIPVYFIYISICIKMILKRITNRVQIYSLYILDQKRMSQNFKKKKEKKDLILSVVSCSLFLQILRFYSCVYYNQILIPVINQVMFSVYIYRTNPVNSLTRFFRVKYV